MLTYHRTSLLTSTAQTVVNTVNTVGVMGKGIAAAFKARYPEMFQTYQKLCREKKLDVGMLWLWKASDQWVLNFPTKRHWRNPSKLEYIEAGLKKFAAEYERRGIREISFPRLGCGNGGLDWKDVRPLMERYLAMLPISVYIHDFEKDIGVPEHQNLRAESFERSFDRFIEQTKKAVDVHDGAFATVLKKAPFTASWTSDDGLQITRRDRQITVVSKEELYELWSLLLRGPVTKQRLPGAARDTAYYIFAILSQLPFIRPVEVKSGGEPVALAIELTSGGEVQTLPSNPETSSGELEWA